MEMDLESIGLPLAFNLLAPIETAGGGVEPPCRVAIVTPTHFQLCNPTKYCRGRSRTYKLLIQSQVTIPICLLGKIYGLTRLQTL